ncbi:MAG: hypothetical protein MUO77_02030, partial [Anaerolineales bacterium]|nr:hypothetical protein [Anaerolineales bacterium]
FSLLFLNNNETTTSLSAIKDEVVWTEHRQDNTFTRMALAAGIEPDSSMAPETLFGNTNVPEAWFLWPIMYTFPDAESTGQFAKSEIKVLKNGDQARKDATTPDKILASASLYPWGVYPHLNP